MNIIKVLSVLLSITILVSRLEPLKGFWGHTRYSGHRL